MCVMSPLLCIKFLYFPLQDEEIHELTKRNEELEKQISALQSHIEKQKNILNRCLDLNKTLLIEKVSAVVYYFFFAQLFQFD